MVVVVVVMMMANKNKWIRPHLGRMEQDFYSQKTTSWRCHRWCYSWQRTCW
jgi:hypothetical protein